MKRVFLTGVLAAALTLELLHPAAGRQIEESPRTVLARVNTFRGNTVSGVRVRIPRPVTLRPGLRSRDIQIAGDGRMAGYVLIQEGVPFDERITLMTTLSRFCAQPGCKDGEPFFWHGGRNVPYDPQTKIRTLPAGDYLFYLIADDSPVEVTLRLRELSGRQRVKLASDVEGGVMLPKVRMSLEAMESAYWFGEEVGISGFTGVSIVLLRFKGDNVVTNRREGCFYSGDPPPDPIAYAPTCPRAAAGAAIWETFPTTGGYEIIDGYFVEVKGVGKWGFGMNAVVGGDVSDADGLFFYVDVDLSEL